MEDISWRLIDTYFNEHPDNLVRHHLDSYNSFFSSGINNIFKENNPIRFIEREEIKTTQLQQAKANECLLYLGGKDGSKIYIGKPVIYDDSSKRVHYMYPNDARLRNMWYGATIHYDVDVDIIYYNENDERIEKTITLEKIYLGKFPIMVQSNLCILQTLSPEVRFNMGECKNDYGGYFIIAGKEKVIISQEKFANNMLYIRKYNEETELYSYSAEIRSVSEDTSKPIRTTAVKLLAPSVSFTNNQIVVAVPNVRKTIPLFILMRALGIISDKDIIKACILDLDMNEDFIDLFIPSVHDAAKIFNQESAILFIATFTKKQTVASVMEILSNYFLPHIGELNFLDKAYFIGHMCYKLLRVYNKLELPTDRDNFKYKRVELSGSLIYDLFREYYLIQKRAIALSIDKEFYFHRGKYKGSEFENLMSNYNAYFKSKDVETGFMKAFKGSWGAEAHTKRVGVIQDLNRLSWNTHISHLRKINLPIDSTSKVVGPRLLNSSQWGFIDPLDSPDGGNIGLHKHLSICCVVTSGTSCYPLIRLIRSTTTMFTIAESSPEHIAATTKIFVNGIWIGNIDEPLKLVNWLKVFRRNGIIPLFTSITFNRRDNEIQIYTDAGRLTRPIYYIEDNIPSFKKPKVREMLENNQLTWEMIVSGFNKKEDAKFNVYHNKIYQIKELYPNISDVHLLETNTSLVDYLDTNEEENTLIAMTEANVVNNKYTHIEIDPSLILGVMGNQIIYPENNPLPRNVFSCGQSKQAVSLYHSNYQMRIDKMGVVLNCGQIPLIKSKYMHYINKDQQPYGVNAIVAIMSYTGYNVEDAILINEASVKRGIFRTTYYSMYEAHEESSSIGRSQSDSIFANIEKHNVVGIKSDYDYSFLDDNGLIKENTPLTDKVVVIGKLTTNPLNKSVYKDSSVVPKKGQLGVVDKSFITEGETGTKLAKVRIREERIPAIGDKMASRAGQKGTLGLIIPEEDMPFTSDGIRPDLIINPHAIPSRMTIGQLIETLFGKACCMYGGFGDCTAFAIKGSNTELYGSMLSKAGFHSSGNQILYNGMSGEQIQSDIFFGPTYYMRLKHMVKDKINYRARGPRTALTHQTVQGRANDGGLRIGEMERDGILAHGASYFLNESYLVRGDEYYMAVCNKTGLIAIYNQSRNIFLSPGADGPLHFNSNPDGTSSLENISRFGRSFSIVKIPYSLKLLIQELQVMNIQMRIITEDNIDQLMSMSYSDNYKLLLHTEPNESLEKTISQYTSHLNQMLHTKTKDPFSLNPSPYVPESPQYAAESPAYTPPESPQYAPYSPPYAPESPQYAPYSPPYAPESPSTTPPYPPPKNASTTPPYPPPKNASTTPPYPPPKNASTTPTTPPFPPPRYTPRSPLFPPIQFSDQATMNEYIQLFQPYTQEELEYFFNSLKPETKRMILNLTPTRDRFIMLKRLYEKRSQQGGTSEEIGGTTDTQTTSDTETTSVEAEQVDEDTAGNVTNTDGATKTIVFNN
jgi:DNA-directed RNA polymerase II subunit RPB2